MQNYKFLFLQALIGIKDGAFADSIHDRITEIFHLYNPSGKIIALVSNQLLTESNTRGKKGKNTGRDTDQLTNSMCRLYCN
jgi:hypothetical protein